MFSPWCNCTLLLSPRRALPVQRQDDLDLRACARLAARQYLAAQLPGVLGSLVGPDAHSAGLGRLESPEQLLLDEFLAHSAPGIRDLDDSAFAVCEHQQANPPAPGSCVDRILPQR